MLCIKKVSGFGKCTETNSTAQPLDGYEKIPPHCEVSDSQKGEYEYDSLQGYCVL
jgi:hypothetical protein